MWRLRRRTWCTGPSIASSWLLLHDALLSRTALPLVVSSIGPQWTDSEGEGLTERALDGVCCSMRLQYARGCCKKSPEVTCNGLHVDNLSTCSMAIVATSMHLPISGILSQQQDCLHSITADIALRLIAHLDLLLIVSQKGPVQARDCSVTVDTSACQQIIQLFSHPLLLGLPA